jgi:hypothetical protein
MSDKRSVYQSGKKDGKGASSPEKRVSLDISGRRPSSPRGILPLNYSSISLPFSDFPEKVMIKIFEHMALPQWGKCGQVCKRWKALINSNYFWLLVYKKRWAHEGLGDRKSGEVNWRQQYQSQVDSEKRRRSSLSGRVVPGITVPSGNSSPTIMTTKTPRSEEHSYAEPSSLEFDISSRTHRASLTGRRGMTSSSAEIPATDRAGRRGSMATSSFDERRGSISSLSLIDETTAASLQTGLANGISLKNLQKSIPDRWVVDELSLDELLLAPLQRTRPTTARTTGPYDRAVRLRDQIVEWCDQFLREYKDRVEIDSLESFINGMPFLALLHKYDNAIVDFNNIEDKKDKKQTLTIAFELAEKHLKIPNILDPDYIASGRDARGLLLYISLFKLRFDQREEANNPIVGVKRQLQDFKQFIMQETASVNDMFSAFEDDCLRMSALSSADAFAEEKQFYLERSHMMEHMLTASKALTSDLKVENKKLKDQNELLFERIQELEKNLALEEERRKRAEEEVQLEEQLRALGTFKAMKDVDLEQFLKDYGDELNKVRTVLNEEEKARQDAKPLVFI